MGDKLKNRRRLPLRDILDYGGEDMPIYYLKSDNLRKRKKIKIRKSWKANPGIKVHELKNRFHRQEEKARFKKNVDSEF